MGRKRANHRAAAQAERIGSAIKTARGTTGFSVAAASARAGIAASTWRRVEHGAIGASVATLCAMTEAVGLDFVAQVYPGREPRLRDTGQLELAKVVSAMVSDPSTVSMEVPAGDHGEAIDMVLWRPDEILAVEIERLVLDAQAQLRRPASNATGWPRIISDAFGSSSWSRTPDEIGPLWIPTWGCSGRRFPPARARCSAPSAREGSWDGTR